MEKLIHVIFVSSAAPDISEHDTLRFVNEARKANRKHDVSGLMLFVGGCFLQVLGANQPASMQCAPPFSRTDAKCA